MRCDQCEALMINGVFCYETGCPIACDLIASLAGELTPPQLQAYRIMRDAIKLARKND